MRRLRPQSGFTLLEIIVVVAIIGIMGTMVGLSIPSDTDHRTLGRQAKDLGRALDALSDHALFAGEDLGVKFEATGFRVLKSRLEKDEEGKAHSIWIEAENIEANLKLFDEQTTLALTLNGKTLDRDFDTATTLKPDLIAELNGQWAAEPKLSLTRNKDQRDLILNNRGRLILDE